MQSAGYARKVKKAVQMLLFKTHRKPGVRGWELKRSLGRDYMKIIKMLNSRLDDLGLRVKIVYEGPVPKKGPKAGELERARFFVTLRNPSASVDTLSGWRVDEIAALTAAIAYITSKQGKAPRKDVEKLLREKFPKWKVEMSLNQYIKKGYMNEDDNRTLYIGWRSRAEIDQKMLLNLLLREDLN